ncbi:MAG: chemotaxis protein CheW [Acidobacteriota bacterium]
MKVVAEETAASNPAGSTRFVTFFFGDDLYGLAADEVSEVTHPLPVSPLPHGPEFLSGISPLRGEIVAVIDVGRMLGRNAVTSSARSKCVVLGKSENETQAAFKVDKMHELATLANVDLSVNPQAKSIFWGTAKCGGNTIKIISPTAIRAALGS